MNKIRAVVFDVDGTLLNTFEHIVRAFELVLPMHGVKPDREAIRQVIGMTLIDCYKTLVPNGDHEAMRKLHHETQQTPEMYDLIVAYDNLREMLETLRKRGLKTAVQTNRGLESIELIFTHIGIHDLFDAIITPDEVTHPKPHPEGTQLLARKLGVPLDSIIIVGDTPIDVQTGKNAGLAGTVAVTHGFGTRKELEAAKPSEIINNFSELEAAVEKIGAL